MTNALCQFSLSIVSLPMVLRCPPPTPKYDFLPSKAIVENGTDSILQSNIIILPLTNFLPCWIL